MSKPKSVTMTLPSSSEFVAVTRLTVSGIAARMNFPIEMIEDLKVSLSEACTNVVQHAYPSSETGEIFITFHMYPDKLEIFVEDHGKGFNPKEAAAPKDNSEHVESFGLGLGLTFIKSLMDEAEVTSIMGKGTIVRMVKHTPSTVIK